MFHPRSLPQSARQHFFTAYHFLNNHPKGNQCEPDDARHSTSSPGDWQSTVGRTELSSHARRPGIERSGREGVFPWGGMFSRPSHPTTLTGTSMDENPFSVPDARTHENRRRSHSSPQQEIVHHNRSEEWYHENCSFRANKYCMGGALYSMKIRV